VRNTAPLPVRLCWLLTVLAVSQAGAAPPRNALEVPEAWIRAIPGADVAAAYLTVQNPTAAAVTLTGVSSPAARSAMIHETRYQDHESRMRPKARLSIAPGQTLRFKEAGLHIMLEGLTQPLQVGQRVPLVLSLDGGHSITVTAIVRPPGAG